MDQNDPLNWRGCEMVDRDGDRIGTIREIYLDADTRRPEWAIVKTGLFSRAGTFVPLAGADREGELVRVRFEKGQVKDAPEVEADGELSVSGEERLHAHYGLAPGGPGAGAGSGEGAAGGQRGATGATRRVRLVKYVVEEVPDDAEHERREGER